MVALSSVGAFLDEDRSGHVFLLRLHAFLVHVLTFHHHVGTVQINTPTPTSTLPTSHAPSLWRNNQPTPLPTICGPDPKYLQCHLARVKVMLSDIPVTKKMFGLPLSPKAVN
mmetsp:Transcript_87516/g.152349  ORF Transcript_87516/g.152349 Transcript_87516/m.152349 type:complete len:112 (-) Transcript_87516:170-505(-)